MSLYISQNQRTKVLIMQNKTTERGHWFLQQWKTNLWVVWRCRLTGRRWTSEPLWLHPRAAHRRLRSWTRCRQGRCRRGNHCLALLQTPPEVKIMCYGIFFLLVCLIQRHLWTLILIGGQSTYQHFWVYQYQPLYSKRDRLLSQLWGTKMLLSITQVSYKHKSIFPCGLHT